MMREKKGEEQTESRQSEVAYSLEIQETETLETNPPCRGNSHRRLKSAAGARLTESDPQTLTMKSFLLLILSLTADAGDRSTVKGCLNMWLEFSCNYMSQQRGIAAFTVAKSGAGVTAFTFKSTKTNVWEQREGLSLYHDKRNKTVQVVIKKLERKDIGKYKFSFYHTMKSSEEQQSREVEVKFELPACQPSFSQTAYRTVGTTITCDYPGNTFKYNNIYLCKEKDSVCEESSRTLVQRQTMASLSVSISNVSRRDQGVYWCAIKEGKYRAAFKRVELQVKEAVTHSATASVGEDFIYSTNYPRNATSKKFFCRGEDPSTCQPPWNNRVVIDDDARNVTITIRMVTRADAGTYWCGAQTTNGKSSHLIFYRLFLDVVPPAASQPTVTTSAACDGGFWWTVTVAVASVALLLFALNLVFIYKHVKNTRKGEVRNNKEEAAYEEIEEHPHKAGSGTAMKTIYVSAGFPSHPSAESHDHSDADSDTCTTVKEKDQQPTYSTVGHPAAPPEDASNGSTPLYYTVNKH